MSTVNKITVLASRSIDIFVKSKFLMKCGSGVLFTRSVWTSPRLGKLDNRQLRTSSKVRANCDFKEEVKKILRCRKDLKLEVCLVDDYMLDPHLCPPSVVIVGAGMAGLSAAHRLASCGITDVTVLEAQDRPGGRIHSCWLDEAVVELGAQWIEGACPANTVFNLACQEGLLPEPTLKQDLRKGLHMTSKGRDLSALVNSTAYHSFNMIDEQAADLYSAPDSKEAGDLEDFLKGRIPQELEVYPEEFRSAAGFAMHGMMNELKSKIGDDLCRVSANQYGSNYGPPGGNVKVPSGMVGVLAPLLRDLPECNIKYCKPVKNISWSSEKVCVKCCDGDIFAPDYCIVTVSLGVLKATHSKMFTPSLPDDKIEAIKSIGYGHINTLYVAYPKPFWVWEEGTLRLAWSLDEMCDNSDWTKNIGVVEEMPNSCQVLMCNVAGESAAKQIESRTEASLAEDLTRICRQFLADPTLPYPSNVIRSKWSSSPFFLGAKSYLAVGSTVSHQCILASPIPDEMGTDVPRLMFAGEATSPGHHATLQGARISGIREAERILRLTKKIGGRPCKCPE